jgi:hypothetical protein
VVPKDPEKPAEDEAEAEDGRPTVTPSYDISRAFSMRPSPPKGTPRAGKAGEGPSSRPTPLGLGAVRPPSPTLTDPEELEAARQKSAVDSSSTQRRVTPVGALSLANARIPSNLPPSPKPSTKKDSVSSLSAVDSDWDDVPTTPPPPDVQALVDESARVTPTPEEPIAAPPAPPPPTAKEMNDRVSVGDFSGALAIAEKLLEADPDDREAADVAATCRTTLKKMYRARIGKLDRVPVVSVARDQMRWLSIDHRAGFVLSLIDGVSTVEMILDVTGMPELDALRILSELVQQRIIAFR